MDVLHAKYFKFVAAGGDLDAASERKLAMNALSVKYTEKIVENKSSQAVNPEDRHSIGIIPEGRGVLQAGTQDDLVAVHGGSHTGNVWTKGQSIRTLKKYDVRFAYYRASDGLLVIEDWTDMNFIPETELSYEQEKMTYLPFALMATATTDVTRDNSAA